jgi:hypothetical protein
MRLRKSPEFRSISPSGVYILASGPPGQTEFRLVFLTNEPVEMDITDEKDPLKNVVYEPHCQAEAVLTRPLAEWLRTALDVYLKKTEVKTP